MDFKSVIAEKISPLAGLSQAEVLEMIEIPPNPEMGDYAFPCFKLAKQMRKSPQMIAADIAEKLERPDFLNQVVPVGGYVNFFIDKAIFAEEVLEAIRREGERYGSSREGEGKTICIDYSSINIAKPFHIGHLSSTAIGNSLYKIYEFLGYKCVGINHLGDWGTQFGKLIVAYKKWGDKQKVEEESINGLLQLYVKFHEEAEKDPSLEDEGRLWFKKIEDGDEEALSIFNWFKEITLKEVQKVYDLLGVHFDSYAGESFYNDKTDRVVEELRQKGLLKESQGAYVVDLEEYNLPPCLILKSDGATLYATRDIAAALYRKGTYNFHKCLYVVAYEQNLHFQQWFKVIELMGYDWAKDLVHVAFGMVSMEDGALSTRKGKVVFLEDVLHRAVEKTLKLIEEKSPDLENKEEVAKKVGIGAVIFNDLSNNRIKDIVFSWDRMLNFDGETGPYVQYTHARSCSVLARAKVDLAGEVDYEHLTDREAQETIRLLDQFPEVVREACHRNEPSLITRHIVDIAQAFNKFYYEHRILDEDPSIQKARLVLVDAVRMVIKTGLGLLGIEAPERM